MVFFFSVTTPFGIVLGMAIQKIYDETSPTALIVVGVLNACSAGLLIYMALVNLLAHEFFGPKIQGNIKLHVLVMLLPSQVPQECLWWLSGHRTLELDSSLLLSFTLIFDHWYNKILYYFVLHNCFYLWNEVWIFTYLLEQEKYKITFKRKTEYKIFQNFTFLKLKS